MMFTKFLLIIPALLIFAHATFYYYLVLRSWIYSRKKDHVLSSQKKNINKMPMLNRWRKSKIKVVGFKRFETWKDLKSSFASIAWSVLSSQRRGPCYVYYACCIYWSYDLGLTLSKRRLNWLLSQARSKLSSIKYLLT